jgi:DNA helicase II / ATP-dependent DNA helicase PcrA
MKKLRTNSRYKALNKNQLSAVNSTEGPLIVVAGPGSGKTELLALRTANIIEKTDTPSSSILCVTFTNAAVFSMRERIKEFIGEEANKVPVYTFHSFCQTIIQNNPQLFFNDLDFSLADEYVKLKIIEDVLKKLEFDDPLKKINPEGGFLYLKDISHFIFFLQESGTQPEEFFEKLKENKNEIKKINKVIEKYLQERVTKKTISDLDIFFQNKKEEKNLKLSNVIFRSLKENVFTGETKKLSQWKQKNTIRKNGKIVIKETIQKEKLDSLALVYKKYQEEMKKNKHYTFSDIILEVIDVLKKNEDLRKDIQEKYLYIQVDEFQDTNGAQMKLLNLITSNAPENKPNICVVGDDDQAIYQFQGADISNILRFKEKYNDTKTIVLLKNYRSHQKIIDSARSVVLKAEDRLEKTYRDIKKNLVAENENEGEVSFFSFLNKEEQFSFITEKIKEEIKSKKINPKEIAVICRTHQEIKEILPYFNAKKISTSVERSENVLEKQPIKQIINILKFSFYLFQKDDYSAESLLPEILTYPFFEIEKQKIWEIAKRSQRKKISWVDCLLNDKNFKEIGEFFLEIASLLRNSPVEEVLDFIMGNKNPSEVSLKFKKFYFTNKLDKKNKEEYLSFLFSIKSFLRAIKKHQKKKIIKVCDLIELVDFYEKNDVPILDKNSFGFDQKAVSLITAHSVKGKEFDMVFVVNSYHETWDKERKNRKIIFPSNMQFERAGNNKDERIRLFYVAMTRAKKNLYLTSYEKKTNGRDVKKLDFLSQIKEEKKKQEIDDKAIEMSLNYLNLISVYKSKKSLLLPLVKEYKLSATGFNKFLNVVDAGPEKFFEEDVLRFPQRKTTYVSYGTAFHNLLREIYRILKKEKRILSENEMFHILKIFLEKERLPEKDFLQLAKKGKKEVRFFYRNRIKDFQEEDVIEKNFKNQSCFVKNIPITGKIDRIRIKGDKIDIFDYKTGKPLTSFNEKEERKKIKAWQYKNQLIFYKLLIESSSDFSNYIVDYGFLDFITTKENSTLVLKIEKKDVERVKNLIEIVGEKIFSLEIPSIFNKKRFKEIKDFEDQLLGEKT